VRSLKTGFGVTGKRVKTLKSVTITCNLAITVVIFYVHAVSIPFGEFARGIEHLTIGREAQMTRDHLEDPNIDHKIVLKRIFQKQMRHKLY
jgi:hypothetical protein